MAQTLPRVVMIIVLVGAGVAVVSCRARPAATPQPMTDAEAAAANVLLVRRSVEEGYNRRNPEAFDAAYHPDAVVWNNGTRMDDGPILEGFRRDLVGYDQQFSEWRIDIEDIFATADRVAVRWVFHGRLRDIGQQVSRTGNWIGRIIDGKVAEVWEAVDE